jgi:hypothetical protein
VASHREPFSQRKRSAADRSPGAQRRFHFRFDGNSLHNCAVPQKRIQRCTTFSRRAAIHSSECSRPIGRCSWRRGQINSHLFRTVESINAVLNQLSLPKRAQTKRILCRLPATNGETRQCAKMPLVVDAAVVPSIRILESCRERIG